MTNTANTDNITTKLLYTPVEAARALGLSRSTLYLLLARGDISSVRIGGSRRIPATALVAFVNGLEPASAVTGRR